MRVYILIAIIAGVLLLPDVTLAEQLVPVECADPNKCGTCEFVRMVNNVNQFIVQAGSLLAVMVFVYAGFLMVFSRGDTGLISKAKGLFTNVALGLVIILAAFIIVDTVLMGLLSPGSPSFNWKEIQCIYPAKPADPADGFATFGDIPPVVGGSCEIMTTGDCTTGDLSCFGAQAGAASQICSVESGGIRTARSGTDLCKDGTSFSHGLYQVNILAHGGSIGGGCESNIFSKSGSGTQGDCLVEKTNSTGVNYCAIRNCELKSGKRSVYDSCVSQLQKPAENIRLACDIYYGRNAGGGDWSDWETTANRCGLPN